MVFVWQFTAAMYYRLASCGRQKDVMPITALRDSKPLLAVTCVITSWSCDCAITLWSWDCANPFKQLILVVHSGCTLSDMLCVVWHVYFIQQPSVDKNDARFFSSWNIYFSVSQNSKLSQLQFFYLSVLQLQINLFVSFTVRNLQKSVDYNTFCLKMLIELAITSSWTQLTKQWPSRPSFELLETTQVPSCGQQGNILYTNKIIRKSSLLKTTGPEWDGPVTSDKRLEACVNWQTFKKYILTVPSWGGWGKLLA